MKMETNKIYNMDCLEGMKQLPDESVDMILCDLPYGNTECKWDNVIPLDKLWNQYKRVIKSNGIIVLTSTEPFTSDLINSNREMFKYDWIWLKKNSTGFLNAKVRPMRKHENILVFSKSGITSNRNDTTYNAQGLKDIQKIKRNFNTESFGERESRKTGSSYIQTKTNYPNTILEFGYDKDKLHPTQKPVALFEYLIKTYSDKGDLILDNCIGSGTTAVACINTGRNFIGYETDEDHFQTAVGRIQSAKSQTQLSNESCPTEDLIGIKRKPCEVSQSLLRKPSLNSDIKSLNSQNETKKTKKNKE